MAFIISLVIHFYSHLPPVSKLFLSPYIALQGRLLKSSYYCTTRLQACSNVKEEKWWRGEFALHLKVFSTHWVALRHMWTWKRHHCHCGACWIEQCHTCVPLLQSAIKYIPMTFCFKLKTKGGCPTEPLLGSALKCLIGCPSRWAVSSHKRKPDAKIPSQCIPGLNHSFKQLTSVQEEPQQPT